MRFSRLDEACFQWFRVWGGALLRCLCLRAWQACLPLPNLRIRGGSVNPNLDQGGSLMKSIKAVVVGFLRAPFWGSHEVYQKPVQASSWGLEPRV